MSPGELLAMIRLVLVAYHEAAHVVVGYLHGLRLLSVTIVPSDQATPEGRQGGLTLFAKPRRPTRRQCYGYAVQLAAGSHGEALAPVPRDLVSDQDLGFMDRRELCTLVPDTQARARVAGAAQKLLDAPLATKAVRMLAAELLRHKTMAGRAAYRLVAAAMRSRQ